MAKSRKENSAASAKKLTIMVSSTVYGNEELLNSTYALLTGFGYNVWMSHKGTLPASPGRSAFENCLAAVEKCDLFLGLITPSYGSGKDGNEPSITHQELRRAIALDKPRWLLVHNHVVFARTLLTNLGFKGVDGRKHLPFAMKDNRFMDDLRLIDMYEEGMVSDKPLAQRKNNWVQQFASKEDAEIFISAQLSSYATGEADMYENLGKKLGGRS